MSEIKSLYRWGSWKTSDSEFAGIRVRQQRNFSITVDLEDNTNKFITEAPITRERSRQRQESLHVARCARHSVLDGSSNVSSVCRRCEFVQYLLDANKLVRDMRRSAAQSLHWRFFKLPRKIAGSNNGETLALALADESLWLARLAWSEKHGAPMRRWHLVEAVRQVGGMLITDSRGIFDALTRSESPQLRLRSSRTSEEARGIAEQCAVSNARIHWVNTLTMLADSLTKPGYSARAVMESFLVKKRWRCTFDPTKSKRSIFVQ